MLSLAQTDVLTGEPIVDPLLLSGFLLVAIFLVVGVALVTQKQGNKNKKKKG